MQEVRNRYKVGEVKFTSLTDVKYYLLKNKEDFRTHTGEYKCVPVMCGMSVVGLYKYIPDLKKVVKIS